MGGAIAKVASSDEDISDAPIPAEEMKVWVDDYTAREAKFLEIVTAKVMRKTRRLMQTGALDDDTFEIKLDLNELKDVARAHQIDPNTVMKSIRRHAANTKFGIEAACKVRVSECSSCSSILLDVILVFYLREPLTDRDRYTI